MNQITISKGVNHKLTERINQSNILAVGELHGIKQNVELYTYLVKEYGFDTLAIEWEAKHRSKIQNYLESGEFPCEIFPEPHHNDGRISVEYIKMMKDLHRNGPCKNFIFFDSYEYRPNRHWNEREEEYANTFLAEFDPQRKTLIVAGNLHTRIEPFTFEFAEGELLPMCYILKSNLGNFPTMKIDYLSGTCYNYEPQTFDDKTSDFRVGSIEACNDESDFVYTIDQVEAVTVECPKAIHETSQK